MIPTLVPSTRPERAPGSLFPKSLLRYGPTYSSEELLMYDARATTDNKMHNTYIEIFRATSYIDYVIERDYHTWHDALSDL